MCNISLQVIFETAQGVFDTMVVISNKTPDQTVSKKFGYSMKTTIQFYERLMEWKVDGRYSQRRWQSTVYNCINGGQE